jgi:hypothetical protein
MSASYGPGLSNYHPNACVKLYTFVSKPQPFGGLSEVKLPGDRLNNCAFKRKNPLLHPTLPQKSSSVNYIGL